MLQPYRDAKGKLRLPQEKQYEARQYVVENLIMRELLYQEGCRRGIKVSKEEVEQAIRQSMSEYGSEREFKAMLLMSGLSPAEYRSQMIRDMTVNKMAANVVEGKKRPVTAEDAKKYYEEHKNEMKGPEARRLLHILVQLDRYAPPQEEQKARQRLEEIRKKPENFKKLVHGSTDSPFKEKREDLGYVVRGQMHPILESVAFSLSVGQVSRVVRTEEGFHLVKVERVFKDGEIRPFDVVAEELQEKLYEIRSVSMLKEFSDKLRKKAKIEIADRFAESKLKGQA